MTEYYELTASDLPELVEYYERFLNSGDFVKNNITAAYESGGYFGIKAVADGVSIGYFTVMKEFALTYPHPDIESLLTPILKGRRFVTVDSLMVLPEYREEGIAHELCKKVTQQLKERDIEMLAVEIWVFPDGSSPARVIYEQMGRSIFKKEVPMFYEGASKYGIVCPICGKDCKCGACIEVIEL